MSLVRARIAGGGRVLAVALVALAAGGCMPQASDTEGQAVHSLYTLFFGAATVVFVIVAGLITWSIFRYRHRGPAPVHEVPLPPQYHGNLILEAIWTTLPILTVIGLFIATLATLGVVQARSADELNVNVTAFQWQWQFQYPGSNITITGTPTQVPVMVVPVNRAVHVTLTSADVNHAFFVPAFLFKQDAIPGHPNQFDFKVTQAGSYRGQCAEFCGLYHDRMIFYVRAVSDSEFSAWLQQQASGSAGATASAASSGAAASSSPGASTSPITAPTPGASPLPSGSQGGS